MEIIFKEESTEAFLLVDARMTSTPSTERYFFKISILCPAISTFVTNCYATTAWLFVIGGAEIRSNDGSLKEILL